MASFWDMAPPETVHEDILALIQTQNPDIEKILQNEELMSTFRTRKPELVNFLLQPQIFDRIVEIMFTHTNIKLSKICVELFVGNQSPLLQFLLADIPRCENLIRKVELSDLVRVAYVSRILQKGFESMKPATLEFFAKSPASLVVLTTNVSKPAVCELLEAYLCALEATQRWYLFVVLNLVTGGGIQTPECFTKYAKEIEECGKQLSKSWSTQEKLNLLKVARTGVNGLSDESVILAVSEAIPVVYQTNSEEAIKVEAFRIATELPRFTKIIKCAAEVAKKPLPWTELNVIALQLLTVTPNKSYGSIYSVLFDRFENDPSNSMLHSQFVKFVSAAIEVPELRAKIMDTIPAAVLKHAQREKWRDGATKVGIYLELGAILDKWMENPSAEWLAFRDKELKMWATKEEDSKGLTVASSQGLAGDIDRMSDITSGSRAVVTKESEGKKSGSENSSEVAKKEDPGFGAFPTFDEPKKEEKKDTGFGGFPTFDEPKKEENKDTGFGGFPSFDEPKKEETKDTGFGGFPTFDEPKKEEKKDTGFGGFPTFDEPKKEENKDNGFGGFPTFDEPKKQEKEDTGFGGFPTFDEPKKEEKEDTGFGGFPTFDEPKKQEKKDTGFGGFPTFDEPKKEETKDTGFGGFPSFDEPKKEEKKDTGFGGFPSFDEPKKPGNEPSFKPAPPAEKPEPAKPIPTVATTKPTSPTTGPADISFVHFMELINNPCWEYDGPSPAELFGQKEQFSSSEEALAFLINQS